MSHALSDHPGERRREGKMRRCAEEGNDEARADHKASKNEDTPMSPDRWKWHEEIIRSGEIKRRSLGSHQIGEHVRQDDGKKKDER